MKMTSRRISATVDLKVPKSSLSLGTVVCERGGREEGREGGRE